MKYRKKPVAIEAVQCKEPNTIEEIMVLRANKLSCTVDEYKQYLLNTLDQYEGLRDLQTKFARGVAVESEERDCKNIALLGIIDGLTEEVNRQFKLRREAERKAEYFQSITRGLAMDQIGHGA